MDRRFLLGLLTLAACAGDPLTAPTIGGVRLEVVVADAGTPDSNGFTVSLPPFSALPIPGNGWTEFVPGIYDGATASIGDVAPWCRATPASQPVEVSPPDTSVVRFDVACDTVFTTVRVITHTTAVDPDTDGYQLDINHRPITLQPNDTVFVHGAAWGPIGLFLHGLAPWCATDRPSRQSPFGAHDTLTVTFEVTCGSIWFDAAVTGTFVGPTPPGAAIYLRSDSGRRAVLTPGDTIHLALRYDRPWIHVDSLAPTCAQFGDPLITAALPVAGAPGSAEVAAACGTLIGFGNLDPFLNAFVDTRQFTLGFDDKGLITIGTPFTAFFDPHLSPDGGTLAGSYDIGYEGGVTDYVSVLQPAAGGALDTIHFTTAADDAWQGPTWTPDGLHLTHLIRHSDGTPVHIRTDLAGGNVDTIALPRGANRVMVWAPDGQHVAIGRDLVDADHGAIVIASPGDTTPVKVLLVPKWPWQLAWSPDGSRIAFTYAAGWIYVVTVSTGEVERLTYPGPGETDVAPEWSADGELIFFRHKPVGAPGAPDFAYPAIVRSHGGPVVVLWDHPVAYGPFPPR